MAVKQKEGENLTPDNIEKVISLLAGDPPITKREACGILNISYNTTRLNKIIEEYQERLRYKEEMRKKLRGKPSTPQEELGIVKSYLMGESISSISESSYRSIDFIRHILKQYKVPERSRTQDYFHPELIPDEYLKEDYEENDLVFSARYNAPALIRKLHQDTEKHGKVYALWLMGKEQMFAYQPWYELANLTHIQNSIGKNFTYEE